MAHRYLFKLRPHDVQYYYVLNTASPYSAWVFSHVMQPAFTKLQADFGIVFMPLPELPEPVKEGSVAYIIYGPTNPLTVTAAEKLFLGQLSARGYLVNIVSAYPLGRDGSDLPEYAGAAEAVRSLLRATGANALFPDMLNTSIGVRTNDWQDVYSGAYSDTVRLKFDPIRQTAAVYVRHHKALQAKYESEIAKLRALFTKYRLWQRDPASNGAILFCDKGELFCTQTYTDKTTMTAADYNLVTAYDAAQNTLFYTGNKLPSSDSPEFITLSERLRQDDPNMKLVVHFHHHELTRGKRFRNLVTADKIEGSRFSSGDRYYEELQHKASCWIILREHGVLWTGETVRAFEAFLTTIL